MSDYSGVSVDSNVFYISPEVEKSLNPGYIKGNSIFPVNDKGQIITFPDKGHKSPLKIYMPRYKGEDVADHFSTMARTTETPYEGGSMLLYDEDKYPNKYDAYYYGGSSLTFVADTNEGTGWYKIKGNNCAMVYDKDKLYGYKNAGSSLKVYLGEEVKYTSIPSYKVTGLFNISAGEYGTADGGTDKTEGIMLANGQELTIEKGAVMTVSGNLINNGTITNKGTIIIQDGGCIASFRPGDTPSANGCGTIRCIGGDIIILKGGALYAGTGDENGADVPFDLDSGSTLVNKGLLVYGRMNLGESARVELHNGSKTYGSWYTRTMNREATLDGSIFYSDKDLKNQYGVSVEQISDMSGEELYNFFGKVLKDHYLKNGISVLGYEITSIDADTMHTANYNYNYDEKYMFTVRYSNMVVAGSWKPLNQIAYPSAFKEYFMAGTANKSNVPQMEQTKELMNGEDLGICVNSKATGNYAPHVSKTADAFFNDPNLDDSVTTEVLTI